jgi:acetyltransferase-like isoleucine patch superfamily enzyme
MGIKYFFVFRMLQRIRIIKYRLISSCKQIEGEPVIIQPVELAGAGKIVFKGQVRLGVYPSPFFFSGYSYLEARKAHSRIEIGHNSWINNSAVMISEGEGIIIGENALLGSRVEIYDSDFHGLSPSERMNPDKIETAAVRIENNVFIGSNSIILKGVTIGENSVIGCNSVVTTSIPRNVVAAGIPARVVKEL